MEALADLHEAELDLEHTRVYAPSSGIATQTSLLQKGQYVSPSNAVLMLVSDEDTWIEANYKETDLTHMQVGQDRRDRDRFLPVRGHPRRGGKHRGRNGALPSR